MAGGRDHPDQRAAADSTRSVLQALREVLEQRGITTVAEANHFLRQQYGEGFKQRLAVTVAEPGSAFLPCLGRERIFPIQHERVVNRDNTAQANNRCLQMEKTPWQAALAGCRVMVYEQVDGTPVHRLRVAHSGPLYGRRGPLAAQQGWAAPSRASRGWEMIQFCWLRIGYVLLN